MEGVVWRGHSCPPRLTLILMLTLPVMFSTYHPCHSRTSGTLAPTLICAGIMVATFNQT